MLAHHSKRLVQRDISKIDREVYSRPENKDFLKTLQTLENGIADEKMVAFSYRDYGTDCKPHFV